MYDEMSKQKSKEIVKQLKAWAKLDNLAEECDLSTERETHEQVLEKIGNRVKAGFDEDFGSMSEWLADVKKVEELATLEGKRKNKPLPNSANVKFPLITKAQYEFASRTYPEIIKDGKVVKGRVIGMDLTSEKQERCERVSDYMNYQLLFEQEEWELELDRLLNRLSLIGFVCKKSYYDPIRKLIKSELCDHCDLIINSEVKSLEDATRISHVIHCTLNDLIECRNADLYCSGPIDKLINSLGENELNKKIDIIEQHNVLDLDCDNYAEPYIVTTIKETGEVLRIAPRFKPEYINTTDDGTLLYIDALQFFTDYHFLVSPKGKFQSVGFGILMLHLNETINSTLNMLLDAGQLANMQGGYKDSRLKNMGSSDTLHDPGEWKTVKAMAGVTLKEGILPINYKEPSDVLFKLLGLMIQTGKDLSSSSEVMTGATSADNAKTGAVQALQQQGLKVFTSIQRRIYRSLTSEFKKIFRLDSLYLDPVKYFTIIDQPKVVKKDDFETKYVHILPVADPNLSSDMQRSQRNQILLGLLQLPNTNKQEIVKEIIQNSNLNMPPEMLMSDPQPDPNIIKIQAEIQSWAEDKKLKAEEIDVRRFEAKIEYFKVEAQVLQIKAQAMLYVAQAQAQQDNGKFQEYEMQLKIMETQMGALRDAAQIQQEAVMHQNEMAQNQQALNTQQQSVDQDGQQQQQAPDSSAS